MSEPQDVPLDWHQDNGYGQCTTCSYTVPNSDEELLAVPLPCPSLRLAAASQADSLDVERLARAWLNAMQPEHNARCLDQGNMDCPVGAEVAEFVPKVAREYAALAGEAGR